MDISVSSSEYSEDRSPSPRQGILSDPYIPPTSKSAIKEGVTISKSRKRKLQKKYGNILRALRAVDDGAIRPSQLAQTPGRMWREAEGLRAILQRPPVTPPRVCAEAADDSAPKASVFCRLTVPPLDHHTPKRRLSPEPERRRDSQPLRRRATSESDRRKEPQTLPGRRHSPGTERRREPLPPV